MSQVQDWKKKHQLLGEAGLSGYVHKEDPEMHRLRVENQALKEMIAEQALALRIKELVPNPTLPLTHLEFDIKYMHVHGSRRNAMMLTVLDVKHVESAGSLILPGEKVESVNVFGLGEGGDFHHKC